MIFIVLAIFAVLWAFQKRVFNQYSPEYKQRCKPIVVWALVFFGICGAVSSYGFTIFMGMLSPYEKWLDFGSNFGQLGVNVAGNLAQLDMQSRLNSTPGLRDYGDIGFGAFLCATILGAIVLLCSTLSIKGVRGPKRAGVSAMSAFYFVSSVLSSICIAFLVNIFVAAHVVENGIENVYDTSKPNFTLIGVLSFIVAVGVFVFIYMKKYRSALEGVLAVEPVVVQSNQTIVGSILSAVTKAVNNNNNPDTARPTKTCPYCGETILAVAAKCKHCGEWLPKEEEKKMVVCPVCGEMVEEGTEVCPYCHERMDGTATKPQSPEQRVRTCPVCFEQVPADVDVCPICSEKIR